MWVAEKSTNEIQTELLSDCVYDLCYYYSISRFTAPLQKVAYCFHQPWAAAEDAAMQAAKSTVIYDDRKSLR